MANAELSLTVKEAKNLLPPVTSIEIASTDIVDAHYQLGKLNHDAIQKAAKRKQTEPAFSSTMELTNKCRDAMIDIQNRMHLTHPDTSSSIAQYFNCLSAWAEGAKIENNTALVLQNDNAGCQTFIVRNPDGSISWGHTEEDQGTERVKQSPWVTFTIDNVRRSYYGGYQDTLPGGAFTLGPKNIMAVDTLLTQPRKNGGFLANAAAWIIWQSDQPTQAEQILRQLTPFYDAYALNLIYMDSGKPIAKTIEFAQDKVISRTLGDKPFDHLAQVNILSGRGKEYTGLRHLRFDEPEEESFSDYKKRKRRIKRMIHLTRLLAKPDNLDLNLTRRLMAFQVGGPSWALSNIDDKSIFWGQLSSDGLANICITHGPVVKEIDDQALKLSAKLS